MPDNAGGNQKYVVMNFETHKFGIGYWDDATPFHLKYGYFCQEKQVGHYYADQQEQVGQYVRRQGQVGQYAEHQGQV